MLSKEFVPGVRFIVVSVRIDASAAQVTGISSFECLGLSGTLGEGSPFTGCISFWMSKMAWCFKNKEVGMHVGITHA